VTHGDARGSRAALAGLASMALPKVERNAEIRGFFNAVALNPDGTTLYATNQDENSVIFADVRTLQTLATVPVGIRPAAIVYAPKPRSP
jgi:YVTN family beta-propeller protein